MFSPEAPENCRKGEAGRAPAEGPQGRMMVMTTWEKSLMLSHY